MKRIEEIKQRRQEEFYKQRYDQVFYVDLYIYFIRMKAKKEHEYKDALLDLERNIDIIRSPIADPQLLQKPQIKVEVKQKKIKSSATTMEE